MGGGDLSVDPSGALFASVSSSALHTPTPTMSERSVHTVPRSRCLSKELLMQFRTVSVASPELGVVVEILLHSHGKS